MILYTIGGNCERLWNGLKNYWVTWVESYMLSHATLWVIWFYRVLQLSLSFYFTYLCLQLIAFAIQNSNQILAIFWLGEIDVEPGSRGPLNVAFNILGITFIVVVQCAKLCLTFSDAMKCSMPGSSVLYYFQEFAQIHVQRCYLTISSSTAPFSFCRQSSPESGSFPMSWLFTRVTKVLGLQY